MSFGFSISDFMYCGQLTYRIYVELKGAPAACQSLSKELLLFSQVMWKTKSLLEKQKNDLDDLDRATLDTCLESCKNILFIQILGKSSIPEELSLPDDIWFDTSPTFNSRRGGFCHGLGERIKQRRLALKIPKLQSEISANVEKLTAFNVLLIQSGQVDISEAQVQLLEGQEDISERLENNHKSAISATDRLEQGQARMEVQLEQILASQQRHQTPILSHSLDASSPEGRQTWMNLGRLLRDEGITPAMIDQNRGLLIQAMKRSLERNPSLADSVSDSYHTAPEYHAPFARTGSRPCSVMSRSFFSNNDHPSTSNPVYVLGSAPPPDTTFSNAFLARQETTPDSLDQHRNVDDGLQSLLQGMEIDLAGDDITGLSDPDSQIEDAAVCQTQPGLSDNEQLSDPTLIDDGLKPGLSGGLEVQKPNRHLFDEFMCERCGRKIPEAPDEYCVATSADSLDNPTCRKLRLAQRSMHLGLLSVS